MSIDVQPEPRTARRPTASTPPQPLPAPPRPAARRARWKLGATLLVIAAAVAGGAYLLLGSVTPASDAIVLTHTIECGDLVVSVTEQGTLESSSNREIKCKVKGGSTVLWVVETGTQVKAGDLLVRLDTSTIEENISQQKILYEDALANKATAESDVAVAKIAITEYLDGTFRSELATKEKELVIAESNLKAARNARNHAARMFRKGYISQLELDTQDDAVKHAELEVQVKQTDLEVLERYTKAKTLQELQSTLEVAEARLASDQAALELEKARLEREEQQLENCTITADVAGMVIYPSAAEWKEQPDIEEGATVREDQVLLMIPDLSQMQVKVGIHESKVDRVEPGMEARVELQDGTVRGEVVSIASVTKPSGWWTGNLVKYDTIIELDQHQGLKPGMSVAVEIFLARYRDVLTVPVAAVVEQGSEFACWIETAAGLEKRRLKLGDTNEQFIIAQSGVAEGERVVLNPLDLVKEAQVKARRPDNAAGPGGEREDRPQPKSEASEGRKMETQATDTRPAKPAGAKPPRAGESAT
jgi:multidrug efflux pump subunit AcrA (membrane-fusion protein)